MSWPCCGASTSAGSRRPRSSRTPTDPILPHKEQAEAEMIARYLPPDLTDEQLDEIVADAIAQTGASGPRTWAR